MATDWIRQIAEAAVVEVIKEFEEEMDVSLDDIDIEELTNEVIKEIKNECE